MAEMVGGRYERAFVARASIGESKRPNPLQNLASLNTRTVLGRRP